MPTDYISYGSAATIAFGGVMGWLKTGSIMSLTMGLLFGGLAGYGAMRLSVNHRDVNFALGSTLTLAGIMGYRFYKYGKFKLMPSGLVFILSLLQIAHLVYRMRR